MKMTKLLASGVAASLAATSLAAIGASAEERTFDMGYSTAAWNSTAKISTNLNTATIGVSADQAVNQLVEIKIGTWWDNDYGWADVATWNGNVTLVVSGFKVDDKGNKTAVKKEFKFNYDGDTGMASIYVLKDTVTAYKDGEFAPAYFDIIENVEMSYPVYGNTNMEQVYKNWSDSSMPWYNKMEVGDATVYSVNASGQKTGTYKVYAADLVANDAAIAAEDANIAAAVLSYALTNGGAYAATGVYAEADITRNGSLSKAYDVLQYTSVDDIIDRVHVKELSTTGAHSSSSTPNTNGPVSDGNQSYDNDDLTQGTKPKGFAGFASQVANFFNKQTNGEITFKFTTVTEDGGSAWVIGGIPSTEVGLKKVLDGATEQDFALFFNYATTGGVMLSAVKVDGASGTVTFDISDYLDSCDGLTSATLNNIYYGLTKKASLAYGDNDTDIGLKVESVTLSYGADEGDGDIEEDDDTDDTDDDDDDDTSDDVDDDDDTDDDDDDDDDDTGITIDDDDDDDDDSDTQGVVVTPADDDEGDGNPNTGVALAVVPAMVAAAAVVVSKKRK